MRLLPLLALASVLCLGFSCSAANDTGNRRFGTPKVLCSLKDSAVSESSGVTPSALRAETYFTHNDSGNGPVLFQFDSTGSVLHKFNVAGAENIDWEDIASAKVAGKNYLYIGDIGDNAGKRPFITVYRVEELPAGLGPTTRFDLKYPDEPHNCEALIVDSKGAITLVTKNERVASVFHIENPRPGPVQKLEKLGDIRLESGIKQGRLVTGGAMDSSNKFVVLRTYIGAFEFDVPSLKTMWFKSVPRKINTPLELQGEAICFTSEGTGLVTTSELSPCQVSYIPIIN